MSLWVRGRGAKTPAMGSWEGPGGQRTPDLTKKWPLFDPKIMRFLDPSIRGPGRGHGAYNGQMRGIWWPRTPA